MKPLVFALLACVFAFGEGLECWEQGNMTQLLGAKGPIAQYSDLMTCETARWAANGGVVCAWFEPGMPLGPEGWQETGWRPMNVETKIGLGRRPVETLETCVSLTRHAAGGIVCTNTGLGFKPTHIVTNRWCGASAQLPYCLQASEKAIDYTVCSFPSEGSGAGVGWVKTYVSSDCEYLGPKLTVEACSASLPKFWFRTGAEY